MEDGRWGIDVDPGVSQWIEELRREGSLAQEYIASVIDSYYGLWGAWDEDEGGMWGIYIAKTREEMQSLDPAGQALLEQFLTPWLEGYEARITASFDGVFSLELDAKLPYTHRSRYLVQATLTGSADASLEGNEADKLLRGNSGDNRLSGGAGEDSVIGCHPRADYSLRAEGDDWILEGPEGRDQLESIERLRFADGWLEL